MQQIDVSSWDEFEERLQTLVSQRKQRQAEVGTHVSDFLFRGQRNSAWRLETTLERCTPQSLKIVDYYRLIHGAKPQIETFTGLSWTILTPSEYETWLQDQPLLTFGGFRGYDYM